MFTENGEASDKIKVQYPTETELNIETDGAYYNVIVKSAVSPYVIRFIEDFKIGSYRDYRDLILECDGDTGMWIAVKEIMDYSNDPQLKAWTGVEKEERIITKKIG